MVSIEIARRLRAAGLPWHPRAGDRFVVHDREMDHHVFVVSEMTIEADLQPSGRVIRFNGTTEWALDSVEADEVTWLPREDQLRDLLGPRFVRLEATDDRFAVTTSVGGREESFTDQDAETAYALAVLAALEAS